MSPSSVGVNLFWFSTGNHHVIINPMGQCLCNRVPLVSKYRSIPLPFQSLAVDCSLPNVCHCSLLQPAESSPHSPYFLRRCLILSFHLLLVLGSYLFLQVFKVPRPDYHAYMPDLSHACHVTCLSQPASFITVSFDEECQFVNS
jgi:hypothetical protein